MRAAGLVCLGAGAGLIRTVSAGEVVFLLCGNVRRFRSPGIQPAGTAGGRLGASVPPDAAALGLADSSFMTVSSPVSPQHPGADEGHAEGHQMSLWFADRVDLVVEPGAHGYMGFGDQGARSW